MEAKTRWQRFRDVSAFFVALWLVNLRAALNLRVAFLMQVLLMCANNLIFFIVWWVFFERFDVVAGFRIHDMLVLYGSVATSFGIAVLFCDGVRVLSRIIVDGELDVFMTQPKPLLPCVAGSKISVSGIGDIASGVAMLVLSGKVTLLAIPLVCVAVLCGAIVLLASGTLFNSAAFWVSGTESFARQIYDFLVTFSVYPMPIFGGPLRFVLFTVLPAGFIGYFPAELIRGPSVSLLLYAASGAIAFALLAVSVFARGLERYASGNRFGVRA